MSNTPLQVILAEDDVDQSELILRALAKLGHNVIGIAATGRELVEMCTAKTPDLVITDIQMPDMDGLDAAQLIYDEKPVPIIVVSALTNEEYLGRAQEQHVLAFLVKPIKSHDLKAAIMIVQSRFAEFQELQRENASLAQTLADRKIIERAKGLLMRQTNLDEEAAFKRLQKLARDQRKKLVDVANVLLVASDVFEGE